MKIAVVVTTYNRPEALADTLPQVLEAAKSVGSDHEVLVVDDFSERTLDVETAVDAQLGYVRLLRLPGNRGLAGALGCGIAYWLADPSVDAIAYFQDDVDVHPAVLAVGAAVLRSYPHHLFTGNDPNHERAAEGLDEHPLGREALMALDIGANSDSYGIRAWHKASCRGTMMMASRQSWAHVMPLRSNGLGLPKRLPGQLENERGQGSGVDWWIVRDAPHPLPVLCVPDLVRIRLWEAKDSTWNNKMRAGADRPLSEQHITEWMKRHAK